MRIDEAEIAMRDAHTRLEVACETLAQAEGAFNHAPNASGVKERLASAQKAFRIAHNALQEAHEKYDLTLGEAS